MPVLAGAAGAAGAVAYGAFKYNRQNYLFDNGLRFSRYTSGYSMAITQASMYRDDIRDLTELTVAKADLYHVVGVIFFVINIQLIMAGRLGVHGPAPPGWMMGLYWQNSVSAMMFLAIYTWFAMHSAARANAGSAFMLTRSVRLPIPSPKQLDKARKTGNSFEKTRATDMFRIPFVMRAAKEVAPVVDEEAGDSDSGSNKASPRSAAKKPTKAAPVSNRRMPKWYQDESHELHAGHGGPTPTSSTTPEHFELYRGLQQEWWGHDVYARIGMLYYMSHWITAAAMYSQCHCFIELRALWPAWAVTFLFSACQITLLNLDIVNEPCGRVYYIPVEYLVPFTPFLTCLGMTLDYSVVSPTKGWQAIIYVISWFAYAIHLAWAWRIYDLAKPTETKVDMPEFPGQPWWPHEMQLPAAFQNAIYMVAPPKSLEPGISCIQQEMKAARGGKGASKGHAKAKEVPKALFPWYIMRGAIVTSGIVWIYIVIGRVIEQVNGERKFLKQEGRVVRWPSHMQPWMTPWSRNGTRNEWAHTGGADRRLDAVHDLHQEVQFNADNLAKALGNIADALEMSAGPEVLPAQPRMALHRTDVNWPAKFRPILLAAGNGGSLAALSSTHHGAIVHLPTKFAAETTTSGTTSHFTLEGVEGLGDLLGASWGERSLIITTSTGALAECDGLPAGGIWPCEQIGHKLPLSGSSIHSAAVARVPSTGLLRAAVAFQDDSSIALFDMDHYSGFWLPAGEVTMPSHSGKHMHFSLSSSADELLFATGNGGVLKWPIGQPEPTMIVSPQKTSLTSKLAWHSVCNFNDNHIVHLASRGKGEEGVFPELYISANA